MTYTVRPSAATVASAPVSTRYSGATTARRKIAMTMKITTRTAGITRSRSEIVALRVSPERAVSPATIAAASRSPARPISPGKASGGSASGRSRAPNGG
jgi:hypothetical protein